MISVSYATTFVPISLKEQVSKSDSIVNGVVVSKSFENDENFGVITHVEVRAESSFGLKENQRVVDIYYPGGELQQQKIVVPGSPNLQVGEKAVLVLNQHKNNFWVSNLGLGKYSLKRVGSEWIMVNQIFPDHPEIGHLSWKRFKAVVEKTKGAQFVSREKTQFEIDGQKFMARKKRKTRYRKIAGTQNDPVPQTHIPIFWLVIIFGALGVGLQVMRKNNR